MKNVIFIMCGLAFGFSILVQNWSPIAVTKENSKIWVTGTSNLHDWEEYLKTYTVEGGISITNNQISLKELHFTAPVDALKSESSIMDKKTWKALKSKQYKKILFNAPEIQILPISKEKIEGNIKGELTLAGTTKTIDIKISGEKTSLGWQIRGEVSIELSEYNISPPTAFFGALKVGNKITVHYKISVK